jgi:Holliday junction DNA helicase RuvB
VRDFADVKTNGIVHQTIAHEALSELKVDELGLEQLDREYLSMITQKFGGGPVGLDTLSTAQKAKIMTTSVCLLMQSHG